MDNLLSQAQKQQPRQGNLPSKTQSLQEPHKLGLLSFLLFLHHGFLERFLHGLSKEAPDGLPLGLLLSLELQPQ